MVKSDWYLRGGMKPGVASTRDHGSSPDIRGIPGWTLLLNSKVSEEALQVDKHSWLRVTKQFGDLSLIAH